MSEGAPLRAATVTSMAAGQQAHEVEQLGARLAAQLSSPADQVPEQELHWEEQEVERARAEEEDQRSREKNARRRTPEQQTASPAAERKPKARKKREEEDKLTRKEGYDTTNNLNKLLTQGFSCSSIRELSTLITKKKAVNSTLISKIDALEAHGLMSKYQDATVGDVPVVDVLRLVRKELGEELRDSLEPHVSPHPLPSPPPSETDVCP